MVDVSHLRVNIGSGNGLVPSGNKPLPEPMLTQLYVAIILHVGRRHLANHKILTREENQLEYTGNKFVPGFPTCQLKTSHSGIPKSQMCLTI